MSANERPSPRLRLSELAHKARKEQGMLLQDLSIKSKIPLSTLRRALNKPETPISEHTLRGLELGLGWPEYAADRILEDPEYRPVAGPRPVHPRTSSAEDVVEFMAEFLDAQPDEYRRFRATIDTNWPDLGS